MNLRMYGKNGSTSTSERIGTSPSVHFRWFTWHNGRHSPMFIQKPNIQVCNVHVARNIASKMRVKDPPSHS